AALASGRTMMERFIRCLPKLLSRRVGAGAPALFPSQDQCRGGTSGYLQSNLKVGLRIGRSRRAWQRGGEDHAEGAALTRGARDDDAGLVLGGNPLGNREAKPAAAAPPRVIRPVEALEDARHVRFA